MSRRAALVMLLIGIMITTVPPSTSAAPATVSIPTSDGPATSYVSVRPHEGPGGTQVRVMGYAGHACNRVRIAFTDSARVVTQLIVTHSGSFDVMTNVPLGAAFGVGHVTATWLIPGINSCTSSTTQVWTPFTVTALGA